MKIKNYLTNIVSTKAHRKLGLTVAIALAFIPFIIQNPYYLDIFITVLLYALLGNSWNIIGGYCGQISLGHALYFGLGAYVSAVLFTKFGFPPVISLLIAPVIVGLLAILLGYPSLRLKGLYFVFFTIAIAAAVRTLFTNWDFVGAATGIYIPFEPGVLNLSFNHKLPYFYLIYCLTMLSIIFIYFMERSRLGRYFVAIRENETQAKALGINTALYKTYAFGISAAMAAIGGVFYAQYVLYISPGSTMGISMSVYLMIVPLIGGAGTVFGPLIGAMILMPFAQYARNTLGGQFAGLAVMLTGLVLMVVVIAAPKGILGVLKERFSSQ